jgi:hypothetical protein
MRVLLPLPEEQQSGPQALSKYLIEDLYLL